MPDGDSSRALTPYRLSPPVRAFAVSDDYFDVLQLQLVQGRRFGPSDGPGASPAVIVSQRLADLLWPKQRAIGHTLQRGAAGTRITVVGVVQNVRDLQGGRTGFIADPRPDAYYSTRQVATLYPEVLIRAAANTGALRAAIPAALRKLDPHLVSRVDVLGGGAEAELITKIFGGVIGAFAIAGLLLSVIGIYGVVAYGVAQRTREIGVRMALGATPESIVQLVTTQSTRFVLIGLAIGVALAAAAGRLLRVFLFQVSSADPATYAVACTLFGAIAVFACWLPARRAARVDPIIALKSE